MTASQMAVNRCAERTTLSACLSPNVHGRSTRGAEDTKNLTRGSQASTMINDPHDRRIRRIKAGMKRAREPSKYVVLYCSIHIRTLLNFVVFACDGVERPGLIVSSVAQPWFHDIGPDRTKAQASLLLPCGLYTKFTIVAEDPNCSACSVSPGLPRAANWLVDIWHVE